jgi:hypothetical protein
MGGFAELIAYSDQDDELASSQTDLKTREILTYAALSVS